MSVVRYLVRHGQTESNVGERILGQSDPDLNGTGLAQAESAAVIIAAGQAGLSTHEIVSSHLKRARITAEAIARKLESPIKIFPNLAERNWGAWTGRPRRDVSAMGLQATPPNGEALSEFSLRVRTAWESIPKRGRTIVVSHGGVFRCLLLHLQLEETDIPTGGVILLCQESGGWQAHGPLVVPEHGKDPAILPKMAMAFAEKLHAKQVRANGAAYVEHLCRVANRLVRAGFNDLPVVSAALLHDTIEDAGAGLETIERQFGESVASLVSSLTLEPGIPYVEQESRYCRRIIQASNESIAIKLADFTDNLTDDQAVPRWRLLRMSERARRFLVETNRCSENEAPEPRLLLLKAELLKVILNVETMLGDQVS